MLVRSEDRKILLERWPYRYVESNDGERGFIQKFGDSRRWRHMYECASRRQLMTAMEDYDYTCWLDPEGAPCYVRDVYKRN